MPYTVYDFLIKDSISDEKYDEITGNLSSIRIDRSYFVGDITDVTDKEVLEAAKEHIKTLVPPNSAHPIQTVAVATGYKAMPVNSSTAAEVVVTFSYNLIDNTNLTQYSVEVSTSLISVQTNAYFDNNNKLKQMMVPYRVKWPNPLKKDGSANDPSAYGDAKYVPAKCSALRPVQNIRIYKTVTSSEADALEGAMLNYTGYTNSTTFRGFGAGQVMCMGIATTSNPYAGNYTANLYFSVRPDIQTIDGQTLNGWDEYARVTNTIYGTPHNIWLAGEDNGVNFQANGIQAFRVAPRANLNTLVAML